MAKRCIVVRGDGTSWVADGKSSLTQGGLTTNFDLDAAFRRGASLDHAPIPLGGTHILLILSDPQDKNP